MRAERRERVIRACWSVNRDLAGGGGELGWRRDGIVERVSEFGQRALVVRILVSVTTARSSGRLYDAITLHARPLLRHPHLHQAQAGTRGRPRTRPASQLAAILGALEPND